MLSQKGFENVIVSDQTKVFQSKELKDWAAQWKIVVQTGSPYHRESNGFAERLIRDLKMFMTMYLHFSGGWKCALEAAVKYHNGSPCRSIGCSPEFALRGKPPVLRADRDLDIKS